MKNKTALIMKRTTITGLISLILLTTVSCSKNNELVYPTDTDTEKAEETTYNRIYYDEEISEEFDPENDYIYLSNPSIVTTESLMRVNPYSCRTSYICSDPLCSHDSSDCPMHMYSSMVPVISYNNRLYYCRGTDGLVDGFNGSTNQYEKMSGNVGYGITEYDFEKKKISYILKYDSRYEGKHPIESMTLHNNRLYYTDWAGDSSLSRGYKVNLYYIDLKTQRIHDLGEYLGYAEIMITDGYIWNRDGFASGNENPIWDGVRDKILLTDLENQNPQWIDVYAEPVDDVSGYILPNAVTTRLLYCGREYPAHVYQFEEIISAYSDGKIYYSNLDNANILYQYDMVTGESDTVINLNDINTPDEISYMRLNSLYKEKYAIYECLGAPDKYNSVGKLYYYMRITLSDGNIAYIYPPE